MTRCMVGIKVPLPFSYSLFLLNPYFKFRIQHINILKAYKMYVYLALSLSLVSDSVRVCVCEGFQKGFRV